MPTCVPATDDFLVQFWPGVVLRTGETWIVAVDGPLAQTGDYSVTIRAVPYAATAAVPPDDAQAIRDGLLVPLGAQLAAAVSPTGLTGIVLQEVILPGVVPAGLGVEVAGPADDTITAELVAGGDSNEATRLLWLDAVLCSLPGCCVFASCPGDYTLMHAALAAHWIYTTMPANVGSTGAGANDFERMRLGPAELSRGKFQSGAQAGGATDAELARTVPGQFFLFLRRKYIFPVMCA